MDGEEGVIAVGDVVSTVVPHVFGEIDHAKAAVPAARLAPEERVRYDLGRLGSGSYNRFRVAALDGDGTELQAEEVSFWASVSPLYGTIWPIQSLTIPGRGETGDEAGPQRMKPRFFQPARTVSRERSPSKEMALSLVEASRTLPAAPWAEFTLL